MMKLVRDRVPELIRESGREPIISVLDEENYIKALHNKLIEEANELLESQNPEELCDIIEVAYAMGEALGVARDELDKARRDKALARGAFKDRLYLHGIREPV